jgi:hypothetical protein
VITRFWAIHLSGPDENRPLDAVVMAARRTKILRLVRLTEYPLPAYPLYHPVLSVPAATIPAMIIDQHAGAGTAGPAAHGTWLASPQVLAGG